MKNIYGSMAELIGNTPLLHIKGKSQKSRADIYAKFAFAGQLW